MLASILGPLIFGNSHLGAGARAKSKMGVVVRWFEPTGRCRHGHKHGNRALTEARMDVEEGTLGTCWVSAYGSFQNHRHPMN